MAHEKTEFLPMNLYGDDDGKICGQIELSELAYPLTVRVYLEGREIKPEYFNIFGHPTFSEEQTKIYMHKNFEYRKSSGDMEQLKLKVTYKVDSMCVRKALFDTVEGIDASLVGLREFNAVIRNRMRYKKRHPNGQLHQFVVWGKYLLNDEAQVCRIRREDGKAAIIQAPVEPLGQFEHNNDCSYTIVKGVIPFAIPAPNSCCPCCGKTLTIYDVKDGYCVYVNDKFYHEKCYQEYTKANEVLEIIAGLVAYVYDIDEYYYEYRHALGGGYSSFLVHTKSGDIIIEKRKNIISIEWQENFKPFDIKEVFSGEDTIKWNKNGKRGIYAVTEERAFRYLFKVNCLVEGEE